MASSTDQCAVAEDGGLLDASQINFYHDPDDDQPLPKSVSTTLVATSRRSGRATRPSARITDPNNLENFVSRKRSATVTTSVEGSARALRRAKLTIGVDEAEDGSEEEDESGDDEVDTENDGVVDMITDEGDEGDRADSEHTEEDYLATKAMGDTDRQVRPSYVYSKKTQN
jgi:hypothetical protein